MILEILLPALLTVLDPQAGGGGSFGGGGGGGGGGGFGGGGGDGDGIGIIVYLLIRLVFEKPLIGVPLLILIVVVFTVGSRKGWWKHQARTIRRARPQREARVSRTSADVLRRADPAFHEPRFLGRVGLAFRKAQDSWCGHDLEPLRPFVSDGVFERFSLQIEEQIEDGWRQGIEELSTGTLTIVHVESGRHFDTVAVRIPFRADIHRLSLETGTRIRGSELPRDRFVECWSFVRRRGAKSIAGAGLIEGLCPNCGAPLTMNQSARCGSCECLARSGEYDWVLTEITQESEWRAESEEEIPGLIAYLERDPGMNVQLLEDRASVAFWRKCAADRAGRVDPLLRVADEGFSASYGAELASKGRGSRRYTADCAVGSVRTLGLIPGEERDRAVVEIVWDGRTARVDEDGDRRLEKPRRLHRSLYVFGRAAGARTRLTDSFTTAHCRTCGAHDVGGTDPACPYCESPRTGDESAWLLSELLAQGSPQGRELSEELAAVARAAPTAPAGKAPPSATGLFAWAAALVHEDGQVEDRERLALSSLADRLEIPPDRVEAVLALPPSDAVVPRPRDAAEGRSWLNTLIELALADGTIHRDEHRFLLEAADHLGLGRRDLERSIRATRSSLYRDSRLARRSDR